MTSLATIVTFVLWFALVFIVGNRVFAEEVGWHLLYFFCSIMGGALISEWRIAVDHEHFQKTTSKR